jgi:hypothetical protein
VTEEKKTAQVAPAVFIKGGTTSGKYDKLMAQKAADAEARRAHQDRQEALARQQTGADGSIARLGSRKLVSSDSPRLVLRYLNKDKSIRQECISEITHVAGAKQGELDMMFSLVCPRCLERGLPQGESQLFVRNSHRTFFINSDKAGMEAVDSVFGRQMILVCGTVTVQDVVKCSNFNCTWAVRIDSSNVMEA